MNEENKKDVITIDAVEYDVENLDPSQQYLVLQIRDVKSQLFKVRSKVTQLQAAEMALVQSLSQSIAKENDTSNNNT